MKTIVFSIVLILSLATTKAIIKPGLRRAGEMIKEPIKTHGQTRDIVLPTRLIIRLEAAAYKLQILRMRVGLAWELVFTDYGFQKLPQGIDLVNHRRKIAIELKNGYRINSMVRRADYRQLRDFKNKHPDYTVIMGVINDRTAEGRFRVTNGVHFRSGLRFLRHIFQGDEMKNILYLKRAARYFLVHN